MEETNQRTITVLMPAYNVAPYIREAIDSVLAQSYADFEFLIINDGSTDDTENIIKTYNDPRIKLHSQQNMGVIGALNNGLKIATGKFIVRFDADDVCYPDRIAVQLKYMMEHDNCVLLGSACDYIDKNGNFLFEWQPSAYNTSDLKIAITKTCPFDHPTVIYKREVALAIGGYPYGGKHCGEFEDHLFWTHFFAYGDVANLDKPLIQHRFNPESVTIDEKWRGNEFNEIKYRTIKNGKWTDGDLARLKEIVDGQDFREYKEAAYYSMIAKKYLWNQHKPTMARQHLRRAIVAIPTKPEPYLLYLLSFFPEFFISAIYKNAKKKKN